MPLSRSLFALTLAFVFAACGGGGGGDLAPVAEAVAEAAPEAAGALRAADGEAALGPVAVYVDLSLSMAPYRSAGTDQTTLFYRLLEHLSNDLGGDVSFSGFGFQAGADSQTVEGLRGVGAALAPASYTRVNNDYAALFNAFLADSTAPVPTRVVVTDGVESDPEGGRRFGGIVGAADAWVRRGGVFAALVFRTAYGGRYFPEAAACAGTGLAMTCPDRPLVAFVLAPDAARLDRLVATLGSGGLTPEYALRVGAGDDLTLTPVVTLPPAPGERRETRLLRDEDTVFVPGFRPFTTARVDSRAVDPATGFFPLTFDVAIPEDAPWRRLPPEAQQAFLQTLRPVVQAWAVAGRDSVALYPITPHVEGARVEVEADSVGQARLRVVVPVRRPEAPADAEGREVRVRQFAWLVSLVPYESGQRLVPDGLSTVDDCTAGACNRTLNLAPLLGAILRDDYVPGRALLLTEWRD